MTALRRRLNETLPVGCAVAGAAIIAAAALTGLWVWCAALWRWVH